VFWGVTRLRTPHLGERGGRWKRCGEGWAEVSLLPREGEEAWLPAGELLTELAAELGLEVDAEEVPLRGRRLDRTSCVGLACRRNAV
jgi:hypothetical protein